MKLRSSFHSGNASLGPRIWNGVDLRVSERPRFVIVVLRWTASLPETQRAGLLSERDDGETSVSRVLHKSRAKPPSGKGHPCREGPGEWLKLSRCVSFL